MPQNTDNHIPISMV